MKKLKPTCQIYYQCSVIHKDGVCPGFGCDCKSVSKQSESLDFKECFECAERPGSPTLCQQCLWVRDNFPPSDGECFCGEINSRNCPKHQNIKENHMDLSEEAIEKAMKLSSQDMRDKVKQPETWEEEVGQFYRIYDIKISEQEEIKTFIQQTLNSQKKELLDEIEEKMKSGNNIHEIERKYVLSIIKSMRQ